MLVKKVIESIEGYRITVHDKTKSKEYSLAEIFSINQDDLVNEFAQQSATYAYFAVLQVEADHHADMVKLAWEQEKAVADDNARATLEEDGKKYTEMVIKGYVDLDEEVVKLAESRLDFEYDAKLMKAVCNSLEMRAQMLIAMGSYIRHEIDQASMKIKERQMNRAVENVDKVLDEKRKR